jgi:hypothetical protein
MTPRAQAKLYRYGGIVVRLYKGRLDPVRVTGPFGTHIAQAVRHAKSYQPLPKRYRQELRRQADDLDRRARMREQGVELPESSPWVDLGTPSGVTA